MKGSKKVVDSIGTICGELWEIVHRSLSVRPGFRNARMQVTRKLSTQVMDSLLMLGTPSEYHVTR